MELLSPPLSEGVGILLISDGLNSQSFTSVRESRLLFSPPLSEGVGNINSLMASILSPSRQ